MEEKKLIISWLKNKTNCIYFDKDKHVEDYINNFHQQMSDMLISSRVHIDDLNSSSFYLLEQSKNYLSEHYYESSHHKHDFKNFNINIHEEVFNKIFFLNFLKKNLKDDNIVNRLDIQSFINYSKDEYKKKNKYLNESASFKYLFSESDDKKFKKLIDDFESSLKHDKNEIAEFDTVFVSRIKTEIKDIEKMIIFYPFVYDHDIFDKNYFLFEINDYRFLKKRYDLLDIVENFYDKYSLKGTSKNTF